MTAVSDHTSDLSKSELTYQVSLLLRNTLSVLGFNSIFQSHSAMMISRPIASQKPHSAEEAFQHGGWSSISFENGCRGEIICLTQKIHFKQLKLI